MAKNNTPLADPQTRSPSDVRAMFSRVAAFYDRINSAMTFGLDARWRRRLALELRLGENDRAIDIACGSGDVGLEIARTYPNAKIVCADFCAPMLELARAKFEKKYPRRAEFAEADCENLPFEDASFGGASVSFGFRNFRDRQKCLREIARVLKPGARLCVLEVARARGVFRTAQKIFMGAFVPLLASLCGGARADYEYLAKSTLEFPPREEVEKMFARAGFGEVSTLPMAFGLVAIVSGVKK